MYWTLDILLDKDPSIIEDKTSSWENELRDDETPKLKFPLTLKEDPLKGETLEFKEPIIKEPKPRNKDLDKSCRIVEMGKNKKNKKNLF
jgi:hypothetical protein